MNETIELLESIAGRRSDVRREPAVPATSAGQRPTRRGSDNELGWRPRTSLEEGCGPNGSGRR